jgi:hypothetical protein
MYLGENHVVSKANFCKYIYLTYLLESKSEFVFKINTLIIVNSKSITRAN